jgi:hypothetical protein
MDGDGGGQPPRDIRFDKRRREHAVAEVAEVGTNDDTIEDWLKRLDGKIDTILRDLLPRVAVLETNVGQLLAAPARFRSWSNWLVNVATALVGGCGCMAVLGAVATFAAAAVTVIKFAMHP